MLEGLSPVLFSNHGPQTLEDARLAVYEDQER